MHVEPILTHPWKKKSEQYTPWIRNTDHVQISFSHICKFTTHQISVKTKMVKK